MPRPTGVNAKRQPIPPLNLEELKFWLRIMEEHALFIKAGLPCDNAALIREADTFQTELATLRTRAESVQSQRQFAEVVADSEEVVADFYRYKRQLLHLVLTCQMAGGNFALYLDHVSREAEYFLILLSSMGSGRPLYQVAGAREVAFWVRLMADHAGIISHRLDPSERTLLETADGFSAEFDELYLQSRDFVSMLRGERDEVPSFRRFLKDVRVSTIRLRDFKRAAEALIAECKVVGLLPALELDHVRREAEHFLLVLAILEKGTYVPHDQDGELEYVTMGGNEAVMAAAPAVAPLVEYATVEEGGGCGHDEEYGEYEDDEDDEDEEYEDDDREEDGREPPPPPEPLSPPEPEKQLKHKWNVKWPRPLGARE